MGLLRKKTGENHEDMLQSEQEGQGALDALQSGQEERDAFDGPQSGQEEQGAFGALQTERDKQHAYEMLESEREKQNAFELLVKRASGCERQALVELCESIAKEVLYRVTRNVGDPTNSEDISQEVLIRICENIRYLREPKAFRAWLSKIVKNEVNRFYKLNSRYGDVLDIDHYLETVLEDKREFLPHEFAENTEERSVITDAVSRLSTRQKQAVMLHYYDDLSVTEVAEAMTVTKQSVSEFLAISREKIKRELSDRGFTNV